MELVDTMVARLAEASRAARYWQVQAVEDLLAPQGGDLVQRLLHCLERAGYADAVHSWAGPGEGRRISPEQLHAALGAAEVLRLAGRAGLTCDELTAALSRHLPDIAGRLLRAERVPRA